MPCLQISVRFGDGRYHGQPDWPPSPARLFQALVAGAAEGAMLRDEDRQALCWLESLAAPLISAPAMRPGQRITPYVPNNDIDAVGGHPGRVGEIRVPKPTRPVLFDEAVPLVYFWRFDDAPGASTAATRVCALARRLYRLGRGADMAWAFGEIVAEAEAEARISAHGGHLHRPAELVGGPTVPVPVRGSLASLVRRFEELRGRLQTRYETRPTKKDPTRRVAVGQVFSQPHKALFRRVVYDCPPRHLLFDLRGARAPWPLDRVVELTERVRDTAARRLADALPSGDAISRIAILGRLDATDADKAARVRIAPLPSIGHSQADLAVRRVLVTVPPNCPLRAEDVEWAFAGLEVVKPVVDPGTGEVHEQLLLMPAAELRMLSHYGVSDERVGRVWRTVTAAALPHQAARRRVDPRRRREGAKAGGERAAEEGAAVVATVQSLRHAEVATRPLEVTVQREPFEAKGSRAEAFASGTRFAKEQFWHIEITFGEPVAGPLIVGDGRYLGLGLMAPVRDALQGLFAFSLPATARADVADRPALLHAVRRALMALARDGDGSVPTLFSGHESDGMPAGSGHHRHVFLAGADLDGRGRIDRLIVAAPWICDRTVVPRRREAELFDRVVSSLRVVRAGRLGVITLDPSPPDQALSGPAAAWQSHTVYRPTRHAGRGEDPGPSLLRDVEAECRRRGLPAPQVELLDLSVGPNAGVAARLRLAFAVAVSGPILLGRDSHSGGGLFRVAS